MDKKINLVDKNNPTHYVNNTEFFEDIIAFREANKHRVEVEGLRPNIPNCIGQKILNICTHLSFKYNFITYNNIKEDMISDAIQNCIRYIWNFDPEKSSNPFSYFTLIAQRSFIKRIQKEKKYTELKRKYTEQRRIDIGLTTSSDIDALDEDIDLEESRAIGAIYADGLDDYDDE